MSASLASSVRGSSLRKARFGEVPRRFSGEDWLLGKKKPSWRLGISLKRKWMQ
ncbi:hypothetical protein VTC63_002599 [Lacticaseibacillus rhamnosus]|uniref:hypothetical protein n=1 Tax=Lacticaseibacillus rhamnosus TaxID=47715 RepID=UPI00139184D5|nr:hypothetical protein [Lacticaseibacillus rhamnosus]MDE3306207.1 hypothetical protein [Lacticaseibacillus rhamnosus]